jgi:hypothetical protein
MLGTKTEMEPFKKKIFTKALAPICDAGLITSNTWFMTELIGQAPSVVLFSLLKKPEQLEDYKL